MAQVNEIPIQNQVRLSSLALEGRVSNVRWDVDMDAEKYSEDIAATLQSEKVAI